GGTDGPCLDVARSVVVSCAPLAAAGGRGSTQEWWEAARGGGLHRRCTPTRPAVRASPGMKGPRGCHASPLVQAFLPLWRSTGEPAIFIRSGQVHGQKFHIPSDLVVEPCVLHNTLDISTRYPHGVS